MLIVTAPRTSAARMDEKSAVGDAVDFGIVQKAPTSEKSLMARQRV